MYDLDSNGFITRLEMVNIIDAIYKMVVSAVVCQVRNIDMKLCVQGQVADDEGLTPDKRVQKIFSQMDTNQDNMLSWEEFREGSRADPRIVEALSVEPDINVHSHSPNFS